MNFRPKGTVTNDGSQKKGRSGKDNTKYPPLPKDGAPMPKKLPKGAKDSSPNNPWVKL